MRNVWDFREIGLLKMLFSDAATEYMEDKGKRLRATILEGYASAIRCHLMSQWGGLEIETITFEHVQDWVDRFDLPGAEEKAYKTFRQIYRLVIRRAYGMLSVYSFNRLSVTSAENQRAAEP